MEVIAANDMGTFASSLQERRKARQQQFGVVAAILKRKFFQGRVESSHTQRKKWHFCTKQKQCGKKKNIYLFTFLKNPEKQSHPPRKSSVGFRSPEGTFQESSQ